ncbi:hypothetical protein ABZZ05_000592 [Listeria monocytogenes]
MRKGIRLKIEESVQLELKTAFKDYAKWLRKEYDFPIRGIKIKLEEINSQFRNKKNYQPATHTKKDNTITPCYLFLYTFHQKSRHPYVLF